MRVDRIVDHNSIVKWIFQKGMFMVILETLMLFHCRNLKPIKRYVFIHSALEKQWRRHLLVFMHSAHQKFNQTLFSSSSADDDG